MNEKGTNIQVREDFNQVVGIINYHRQRVSQAIDDESLRMIWEVGAYVSNKLKNSEWGTGVVRQLSEFIRTQDPTIKGWSYRTIYKMVQFYEAYSSKAFEEIVQKAKLGEFTTLQLSTNFVPFEMAQIPTILFSTGWTNHQIIMSRCKNDNERLFYMLYAQKEHLQNKQLERAIKTDTMSSILRAKDIQSDVLHSTYINSPALFKDTAYLDFLGLDQEERRSNENPTIGIILCKESDMETVRFALNRSMSPMMIMEYKEQLKVGSVIQRSIEEYCKYINSENSK